jgi:outer membrane protein
MNRKTILTRYSPAGLILIILLFNAGIYAQKPEVMIHDSASLNECISYAFKNQPLVKQLKLDEDIANQDIRIAMTDWLPQLNSSVTFQDNIKRPTLIFPNFNDPTGPKTEITTGVNYNSSLQLSASQTIFNNSVYLAGSTAKYYRKKSKQTTNEAMIGLVVNISKAYYDVLLTWQQMKILNEDIQRLDKSLKDAFARYQNGISDKIDYKRATISLNNARTQKVSAEESIKAKYTYLKQLMGYPADRPLVLSYDSIRMQNDMLVDTLAGLSYSNRIEYQLLETNLHLQRSNINYYKLSFLPSLSGYANYNFVYQNDLISELYKKSFPNSSVGLTLSFPLFQSSKRMQNLRKANLQYERLALDTLNLKNQINTEYAEAIASYKSNLTAYRITQQNIDIARDVYNTVKLQYDQGVKSYLEVIVSETDLRTAQINNLNALFKVLSSKLDVEQALGNISINY